MLSLYTLGKCAATIGCKVLDEIICEVWMYVCMYYSYIIICIYV